MVKVERFIKEHTHINYCEAIIYPNGDIEYSIPSHERKLIEVSGLSFNQIQKLMPIEAGSVAWLVDYTGCCAIYYDFAYVPDKFTRAQIESIQKLIDNKIISKDFSIQQLFEKQLIESKEKSLDEYMKICKKRYIGDFNAYK